ncbi:Predicted methyltransferase regulatory domain-containing protein [Duganella sp. CF458]|uniref:class I SAM-dependent methyltransferase n=1 Tax=Duganella sp. CF458 TaxID=1884368 RepID=UPI0008F21A90|nr:class I SAM-dependent methyltransferase [Duganella sp. CF458]SFF95317.1 Predicted methyltransferase regulatory domain-containing protein [Duganella sp. CF458]
MDKLWWEPGPEHLNFACVLAGMEPVPLDRAFNYLVLGCGGESAQARVAGGHPRGSFHAADAGMPLGAALPPMDFIVLRGAYSWLDRNQRQQVIELINACLKPGGVAYIGYDALPGCSSILPLQRLVREQGGLHAAAQVEQLRGVGAAYFADNDAPAMRSRLDAFAPACHEFTRRGWEALYHADVARALADAKLEYVASADLWWSDPGRYLSAAQRALLDAQTVPILREMVRDILLDTAFRRDVYIRGARRMHPMRQADWLGKCPLSLSLAEARAEGRDEALFASMLDALAVGPQPIAALASLPEMRGKNMLEVARLAGLLLDSGHAVISNQGA